MIGYFDLTSSNNVAGILSIIAPGVTWDPSDFQDGNGTVSTRDLHRIVRRGIFSKIGKFFKSVGQKVVAAAKTVGSKIESTAKKVGATLEAAAKTAAKFANNVVHAVIDHVFVSY